VEDAVGQVEAIYKAASTISLKLKQVKQINKKKAKNICNKKWFDFDCKKARKELRQLSNQKHSNPLDSYIRKLYYHKLKNFKKLLKFKKYNFQEEKLHELEINSNSPRFWKIFKSANEEIQDDLIPPISENQWIKHFESLHGKQQLSIEQTSLAESLSLHENNSTQFNLILNSPINEDEIQSCAKALKNNKAASFDRIRNEMIRHSINNMGQVLLKFFNLVLDQSTFPSSWCVGSLTPIFKSGNISDTNNYRGICVSSCLGKFFTLILNQRLLKFVRQNNILHNSQIGFLPGNRTSDHIFTLRTIIDKYVKNTNGGRIYACFIDFKKAFDSVWHDGLLLRLLQYNINGKFYKLIKHLYSNSSCYIKLGSRRTRTFQYSRGVRQGCILSPLLFNLYLNELSILLNQTARTDPIFLPNNTKLSSLLYADDLVLLSHSRQGLQNSINSVVNFCKEWQMNINEKKSKVMIFCKRISEKVKNCSFTLNNSQLQLVQNFTYFGVKLSHNGNFTAHLNQSQDKALHAFYKLTQNVDIKKLKPKQANTFFDSLISSILTYGSEVWGSYEKQNFEKWDKKRYRKSTLTILQILSGCK